MTKQNEFSEFRVDEMTVKVGDAELALNLGCVGTAEETLGIKTITKKCKGVTVKKKTKQTGEGEVKITAHVLYDAYAKMYGMDRSELKEGVKAFGGASLPNVCAALKVLDEDDNVKVKAYPNCTVASGPARKIDSSAEDVAEVELTLALAADEHGDCMYEYIIDEENTEDVALMESWMTNFNYDLVKKEGTA